MKAYAQNGSIATSGGGGDVSISALDTVASTATAGGGSLAITVSPSGGSAAVGAAIAENHLGDTVSAYGNAETINSAARSTSWPRPNRPSPPSRSRPHSVLRSLSVWRSRAAAQRPTTRSTTMCRLISKEPAGREERNHRGRCGQRRCLGNWLDHRQRWLRGRGVRPDRRVDRRLSVDQQGR